jgi:hypothetical protein
MFDEFIYDWDIQKGHCRILATKVTAKNNKNTILDYLSIR